MSCEDIVCDHEINDFTTDLAEKRDYIKKTLEDKKAYKNDEVRKAYDVILTEQITSLAVLCGEFWKSTLEMATHFEKQMLGQKEEPKPTSRSLLERQLSLVTEMVREMVVVEETKPSDTPVAE